MDSFGNMQLGSCLPLDTLTLLDPGTFGQQPVDGSTVPLQDFLKPRKGRLTFHYSLIFENAWLATLSNVWVIFFSPFKLTELQPQPERKPLLVDNMIISCNLVRVIGQQHIDV